MTPHQQWEKSTDIDMLTCKSGYLLLQKNNGNPACVMPSTYLKLIDRGYGNYDQLIMDKNPDMMNTLMIQMTSDDKVMSHWHSMMQQNPKLIMQTMDNWVLQMKDNPELLKNMLSPMTSDPELRKKTILTMKNHPQMETVLKSNSIWMDSIHQPIDSGMEPSECVWCTGEYQSMNSHEMAMTGSKMMDVIHHVWINSEITKDMHTMMLEDPAHMAIMSNQMIEPMLYAVMDDEDLREEMIDLMLQHKDFMNSIRHENPTQGH